MDFQDIIIQLNRYWAKQGCALMPPSGAARPHVPGRGLCLAGLALRQPAPGSAGRYLYQVFLDPAPADIRRAFLHSLKAAGIDRSEHDVRWLAADTDFPEPGRSGFGWEVLLDGMPLARFVYLHSPDRGASRPAGVEITIGLERLALVSQRKKQASELAWAGRLTYGELHPAPAQEGQ